MRYWKWVLLFALVAIAIVFSFMPQTLTVEMGTVERGDLLIEVEEDGRTRVRDRYTINTPINGMLRRPRLKAGDPLVAGETVIAVLDPTVTGFLDARSQAEAEARVKRAQAAREQALQQLRGAETSRDFAKTELNRLKGLGDFASEEAVDMAAYTLRLRESEVMAARKALNVAEFELETQEAALAAIPSNENQAGQPLTLTSPVNGAVFRVFQESSGFVSAGTPLMEVGDPADLEVVVDLLSKDAVNVKAGQKARLLHWGGDRSLNAEVRLVEPSGFTKISALGVEEQRVNVILDLTDPKETWQHLGDGFRAEVAIVTWEGKDLVRVPASALFWADGDWAVYKVDEDRARRTALTIGRRNANWAEVDSELKPGDRVVIHPSDQMKDGVKVAPRELPEN